MKILTVSASPYLLVRNGRINSDIIIRLKDEGYEVSSAVWHHDDGYFLPNSDGVHSYEVEGKHICELYPFVAGQEQSSTFIYEIMKKTQPDIVISIGDYKDTDYIYAVKAMYPNLFKWVSIFTVDCLPINEIHKDYIEYSDYIISTSDFGARHLSCMCSRSVDAIIYGPDHSKFFKIDGIREKVKNFSILNLSKNSQVSNLGAFIRAIGKTNDILSIDGENVDAYLHTNLFDPGESDLDLLIDRYAADQVRLPEDYVSIKESIPDSSLNDIYNSHHCFVDCSVKSATGIGLLEAMSTGCLPVGPDDGMVGEIISNMPVEYQFFVPHEIYIGKNEEEFYVISIEGLVEKFIVLKNKIFEDRDKFSEASEAAIKVAKGYSNKMFTDSIVELLPKVVKSRDLITIEGF